MFSTELFSYGLANQNDITLIIVIIIVISEIILTLCTNVLLLKIKRESRSGSLEERGLRALIKEKVFSVRKS